MTKKVPTENEELSKLVYLNLERLEAESARAERKGETGGGVVLVDTRHPAGKAIAMSIDPKYPVGRPFVRYASAYRVRQISAEIGVDFEVKETELGHFQVFVFGGPISMQLVLPMPV